VWLVHQDDGIDLVATLRDEEGFAAIRAYCPDASSTLSRATKKRK
jgi:hypothetical protein